MANLHDLKRAVTTPRRNRYFSEELKQKLVRDIENNLVSIAEISRQHQVNRSAVYKWIYKYSSMRKKSIKMVVESKSVTRKIAGLKEKVRDLEQLVGQKQITIEFLEKMIELAEKELGIEIKKKERK